MNWRNDPDAEIKYFLLDFLIKSQHQFRDKDPFQISLKEAMDYVEEFVKERWNGK